MKAIEAIKVIEWIKNTHPEQITCEALTLAISALEKQEPVKVDSEWDRYYGKNNPCCGACGAYVDEYSKYCKRCGRPIDWRD